MGHIFMLKKDLPQYIKEAFHVDGEDVHSDHDQMHQCGLSEKREEKNPLNEWVNKASKNIATAFNDHDYGKQYEELKEQAELMEIEFL